jgi:hypothetical protein
MDQNQDEVDLIQWAKDVLFAMERIRKTTPAPNPRGRPPTKDVSKCPEGVSERQFELWRIGRESPDTLTKTMFPRAFSILAGERDKEAHEEIAKAEARSVEEMKELLATALAESQGTPAPVKAAKREEPLPWDTE